MSVDLFQDWGGSNNGLTYRQIRHLRELDREVDALTSSLAAQQEDGRRLRSQLAAVQGSIEFRLTRLTQVFDAFIELSDVRAVLALFDEPALVRHRCRALLSGLAARADLPAALLLPQTDVPGYWLAPAARATVALLSGAAADADVAAARDRDPRRSATLIAGMAAVSGRGDIAGAWIGTALGDITAGIPLTATQRLLWLEAAGGAFGPQGVTEIETRLRAIRAALPSGEDQLAAKLHALVPWPGRIPPFDGVPAIGAAVGAAAELAALRALCVPADIPAQRGAPAESLVPLIQSLVDEGTDEEEPLLRRAAELRAIIENRPAPAPSGLATSAGLPEDLLLADALDASAGPAGTLARRVLSAEIIAVAARLAIAAAIDPPRSAAVDLKHGRVEVTAAGANPNQIDAVRAAIDRAHPAITIVDTPVGILAGAAAVVAATDAVLSGPAFAIGLIAAIGLVIGAAGRSSARRTERVGNAKDRADALRETEFRIGKTAKDLAAALTRLTSIGVTAAEDRAAIGSALAVDG